MPHDSDAVSRTDTERYRGWIRSLAEGLQGLFLLVDASGALVEAVVHGVLQKRLCAMEPVAGVSLGQFMPPLAKVLEQGLTICRHTGYLQKNDHLVEEEDGILFCKSYIIKYQHNLFSVVVIDSHHERSLTLQVAALEADQRQTIQLLHELDARYRTLFDSLNEGVVFVARDGQVLAANETAAQMFRTTPSDFQKMRVDGRPLPFRIIGEDLQPLPLEQWPMSVALSSGLVQRESVVGVVFPSSGPFWLVLNARPLWRSGESVPYAVVVSFFDITLRKQLEQELHHRAFHDALTSLPNRSLFIDRLDTAIRQARRAGDLIAVFFVDLNGFKSINDELGHDIGDQFLQAVARRLSDSLRDGDTVARFGGDEFTILLPSLQGAEDALRVAERVLEDLQQPMVFSGVTLTAGASVGISLYPYDGSDSAMLIRNADLAMYRVKAQGRNGCEFFSKGMGVTSGRLPRSDSELNVESITGQLGLRYRPQVDLRSGQVLAWEAELVRLDLKDLGEELLNSATHDESVAQQLFRQLLERAGQELITALPTDRSATALLLRIEQRQLLSGAALASLTAVLPSIGLPPQRLILDVVASTCVCQSAALIESLWQLAQLGVRLTLSAMTSLPLEELANLPVSALTIPDRLWRRSMRDERTWRLCEGLVVLAERLDLTLTADGILSQDEQQAAIRLGCQRGQGPLWPDRAQLKAE